MPAETINDLLKSMPDMGGNDASFVTATRHEKPNDTIDPTKVKLPQPFVVSVVGASRGIGAGVAFAYAKAGATGLILSSRRVSGLEQTAAECKKINPKINVEIIPCDIVSQTSRTRAPEAKLIYLPSRQTSAESVRAMAEKTKAKFDRLDVVVVNSGYSGEIQLKITEADVESFQNATNVNYVGTFLCAKYLIPQLLETKDGAKAFMAVNTLASLIVRGPIANAQYCVSKTAQLRLMEHIHEQYHEEGLTAFSVHPGAFLSRPSPFP